MTIAALACANARIHARKARMLAVGDLVRLGVSDTPSVIVPGWRDTTQSAASAESILSLVFGRLVSEYVVALRMYPGARDALLALLRLHEVENIKLAWRAAVRGHPFAHWAPLWRPLGRCEALSREACRSLASARSLADLLASTLYRTIAAKAARAHGGELAAAEITFDRWAAAELERSAAALPAREWLARDLLSCVAAGQRDRMAARLGGPDRSAPADGRSRLRRAIPRAFRSTPYSLAHVCAYILARESEARGLLSVVEARSDHLNAEGVRRVLEQTM